ncbi:unnamed protein product [Aphis gossypii]|uniref:Uncharacterized protein n=1 Tax=Aphis gossypii TaxID=80765 RepID=A0A9P0NES1_APHGO|nr:unnamed protein product [Aphis gossypii]
MTGWEYYVQTVVKILMRLDIIGIRSLTIMQGKLYVGIQLIFCRTSDSGW